MSLFCDCCWPSASAEDAAEEKLRQREKDSLLTMYGIDELSEARPCRLALRSACSSARALLLPPQRLSLPLWSRPSRRVLARCELPLMPARLSPQSEDDVADENPMSPEQIKQLLDRQIALTQANEPRARYETAFIPASSRAPPFDPRQELDDVDASSLVLMAEQEEEFVSPTLMAPSPEGVSQQHIALQVSPDSLPQTPTR